MGETYAKDNFALLSVSFSHPVVVLWLDYGFCMLPHGVVPGRQAFRVFNLSPSSAILVPAS